jgi:menaquinone-specific isochorismate synthase
MDSLVMRVWGAYRKFGAFDYAPEAAKSEGESHVRIESRREIAARHYPDAVGQALEAIQRGDYEKIVLARGIELGADRPWQPLNTLNRLRELFSGCFTFSYGGGGGRSFIGATPERLLQIRDGRLLTEAIAGSAPRGDTAGEDAKHARALLDSAKDLHEHICVRDSILRRLARVGVDGQAEPDPQVLLLANLQHLRTRIEAAVGGSVHLLDILPEMHPTPAVGGSPRENAVPRIQELEQLERGLYAGVVGWFNHLNEGEMIVGIRSALIEGRSARLYAGAGIVKGSDPEKEMRETEMKLSALLGVLKDGS